MKKTVIYLLLVGVICVGQSPAASATSDPTPTLLPILISELQTGGAQDATEEFVELYNPNATTVNITGWLLQYRAASGTATQTWPASTTKATIACAAGSPTDCMVDLTPMGRLVLVHTLANIAGSLPMSGGFSGTGGEIRLVQPGTVPVVHDYIGYGAAADSEGQPAPAPAAGQSIKRVIDTDGNPIDTNNNAADFIAACGAPSPGITDTSPLPNATGCTAPASTPSPGDTDSTPPPADAPTDPLADDPTDPGKGAAVTYLPVIITEVFPDPASPQQDSTDESIELYNPNDSTLTLKGYTLQTGSEWRYHFTLGDTPLGPHNYIAISSAVSNLSLSNNGSGVRLIDPSGTLTDEVPTYGNAKQGQSWMQDDTGWHWTLTPTPNAPNILTVPAAPTTPAPSAGTTKKKASTAASSKITVPKAPKAPAAKKTTKAASAPSNAGQAFNPAQTPQYWLLLPIGLITGGYAVYEYRQEIAKFGRKTWARLIGKSAKEQPLLGDPEA